MGWKDLFETIYYIAGTIAAIGTLVAAVFALCVYRGNSRLERARWASTLYEKFFEKDHLKKVRTLLDCPANSDEVNQAVTQEDSEFTDYLNFFEFISVLENSKQLTRSEVEDLFGYYLDCLQRHELVRSYIDNEQNGYEGLAKLLRARDERLSISLRNPATGAGTRQGSQSGKET